MPGRYAICRSILQARRKFAVLALGAVLLRALIPLGYMPGNALAGEFVVLCPTGLPAAIAQTLHDGHLHHEPAVDMDQECPIGNALQTAALPAPLPAAIVTGDRVRYDAAESVTPPYRAPVRQYPIRGPPLI